MTSGRAALQSRVLHFSRCGQFKFPQPAQVQLPGGGPPGFAAILGGGVGGRAVVSLPASTSALPGPKITEKGG